MIESMKQSSLLLKIIYENILLIIKIYEQNFKFV